MEHRISRCIQRGDAAAGGVHHDRDFILQRHSSWIIHPSLVSPGDSIPSAPLPPSSPSPSLSLPPPPSPPRFLVIYPGAPASGLSAISARSRLVIINAANYSANSLAYLVSSWTPYSEFSRGSRLPFARPLNEFTTLWKGERERERETEKEKRKRRRSAQYEDVRGRRFRFTRLT